MHPNFFCSLRLKLNREVNLAGFLNRFFKGLVLRRKLRMFNPWLKDNGTCPALVEKPDHTGMVIGRPWPSTNRLNALIIDLHNQKVGVEDKRRTVAEEIIKEAIFDSVKRPEVEGRHGDQNEQGA